MQPHHAGLLSAGLGVGVGLALVLGAALVPPLVLAPVGTTFDVPAFTPSGPADGCGIWPCGSAGVAVLQVTLILPARLSGTLSLSGPLDLIVANNTSVECGLFRPPAPCPGWSGPNEVYGAYGDIGPVVLQSLQLNFSGPDNLLPAGHWTIYFVNWSSAPIHVTVNSEVRTATQW